MLDFGTNVSSIDPQGFKNNIKPVPKDRSQLSYGQSYTFDNFDFFGYKGDVRLLARKSTVSNLGFDQAGIVGTDFFMENIYAIDYVNKFLYKTTRNSSCQDADLLRSGFKPVSSAGYYVDKFVRLIDENKTYNIPTVPVTIGNTLAMAQIDPAYDDSVYPHTVNINQLFFEALKQAGVDLVPMPNVDLTTCTGVNEKGSAYKLGPGFDFRIMGTDGKPVLVEHNAFIIVKGNNSACEGIGTWSIAAAQIGASFLNDSGQVIFDPFSSRVWFYSALNEVIRKQSPTAPGGPQVKPPQHDPHPISPPAKPRKPKVKSR